MNKKFFFFEFDFSTFSEMNMNKHKGFFPSIRVLNILLIKKSDF
jgi:hypothetical protein